MTGPHLNILKLFSSFSNSQIKVLSRSTFDSKDRNGSYSFLGFEFSKLAHLQALGLPRKVSWWIRCVLAILTISLSLAMQFFNFPTTSAVSQSQSQSSVRMPFEMLPDVIRLIIRLRIVTDDTFKHTSLNRMSSGEWTKTSFLFASFSAFLKIRNLLDFYLIIYCFNYRLGPRSFSGLSGWWLEIWASLSLKMLFGGRLEVAWDNSRLDLEWCSVIESVSFEY